MKNTWRRKKDGLISRHFNTENDYQDLKTVVSAMEHHTFKNVNNFLNTNIYSYLETSGGQSSYLYLNVHFFNTSVI